MTVAELIEKLREMPQEAEVVVSNHAPEPADLERVILLDTRSSPASRVLLY